MWRGRSDGQRHGDSSLAGPNHFVNGLQDASSTSNTVLTPRHPSFGVVVDGRDVVVVLTHHHITHHGHRRELLVCKGTFCSYSLDCDCLAHTPTHAGPLLEPPGVRAARRDDRAPDHRARFPQRRVCAHLHPHDVRKKSRSGRRPCLCICSSCLLHSILLPRALLWTPQLTDPTAVSTSRPSPSSSSRPHSQLPSLQAAVSLLCSAPSACTCRRGPAAGQRYRGAERGDSRMAWCVARAADCAAATAPVEGGQDIKV